MWIDIGIAPPLPPAGIKILAEKSQSGIRAVDKMRHSMRRSNSFVDTSAEHNQQNPSEIYSQNKGWNMSAIVCVLCWQLQDQLVSKSVMGKLLIWLGSSHAGHGFINSNGGHLLYNNNMSKKRKSLSGIPCQASPAKSPKYLNSNMKGN